MRFVPNERARAWHDPFGMKNRKSSEDEKENGKSIEDKELINVEGQITWTRESIVCLIEQSTDFNNAITHIKKALSIAINESEGNESSIQIELHHLSEIQAIPSLASNIEVEKPIAFKRSHLLLDRYEEAAIRE